MKKIILISTLIILTVVLTAQTVPTGLTTIVSNITSCNFTVSCNAFNSGGATVTEKGFVYQDHTNPIWMDDHTAVICKTGWPTSDGCGVPGTDQFAMGIAPNDGKLYIRSYAKNSVGIGYGPSVYVELAPKMTTGAVTNKTKYSATVAGTVVTPNCVTVTDRGICWNTAPNPTHGGDAHVHCGSGTGNFTGNLTGLTPNTLYYVRSFGINGNGTGYGNQITFTTLP